MIIQPAWATALALDAAYCAGEEILRDLRQETDRDEFRQSDGESAKRQGEQCEPALGWCQPFHEQTSAIVWSCGAGGIVASGRIES